VSASSLQAIFTEKTGENNVTQAGMRSTGKCWAKHALTDTYALIARNMLLFMSIGQDDVGLYKLWPPTGPLFNPQTIYEYGEPRWNDVDRGKKNSEKIQFQCHIVYQKTHTD
jgi:hypothetical protein